MCMPYGIPKPIKVNSKEGKKQMKEICDTCKLYQDGSKYKNKGAITFEVIEDE
jgi:hypothetical protein